MFIFSNLAALNTSAFVFLDKQCRRDLKSTTPGDFGHRLAIKQSSVLRDKSLLFEIFKNLWCYWASPAALKIIYRFNKSRKHLFRFDSEVIARARLRKLFWYAGIWRSCERCAPARGRRNGSYMGKNTKGGFKGGKAVPQDWFQGKIRKWKREIILLRAWRRCIMNITRLPTTWVLVSDKVIICFKQWT